jgi:hypothetical protein
MGNLDSRDREISVDGDVKAVLSFMQDNLPASKLVVVAEALPQMARLLWGQFQQEPFAVASFDALKKPRQSQLVSTESVPAPLCAGGDFVEAKAFQ